MPLKPGPWGDLEFVPLLISPPAELLPVKTVEEAGTTWLFPCVGVKMLAAFLEEAGVPEGLIAWLTDPARMKAAGGGVEVRPDVRGLAELPPAARQKIFRALNSLPGNRSGLTYFYLADLDRRFAAEDVDAATVKKFKSWCVTHGDYAIFSGLAEMLSEMASPDAKLRFLKALSQQKTLLLRLHVSPESDVEALTAYWAKGESGMDVKELLSSVSAVPGGTWLDVVELLPKWPAADLHSFPKPGDAPEPGVRHDCHWTAFNFFRDPPDPRFGRADAVREAIMEEYTTVEGAPQYGDVVMLSLPGGSIIHSAVYLADDVVYSKNGDTPVHPWMLSRISDMLAQYSFMVEPGEHLTVSFLRSRSL